MRASVTARNERGTRVRYLKVGRQFIGTKAEAEQALSRWIGQVDRDQERTRVDRIASVRTMTVNQLVERYLVNIDVDTLTLTGYRTKYRSFIARQASAS